MVRAESGRTAPPDRNSARKRAETTAWASAPVAGAASRTARARPASRRSTAEAPPGAPLLTVDALDEAPAVEEVHLRGDLGGEANLAQERLERQVRLPAEPRAHG